MKGAFREYEGGIQRIRRGTPRLATSGLVQFLLYITHRIKIIRSQKPSATETRNASLQKAEGTTGPRRGKYHAKDFAKV